MSRDEDDSRLVAAAVQGDRGAFALLIDRHRPRMAAVARRLLGDPADAEDVVQDAVLRAYLGLEQLRDPARFGSWLYGITINLARMRRRARERAVPLEEALLVAPAERRDELGTLRDALAVLPAGQREVVVMYYVVGLSGPEIASLLGRSPGAVRVQLHRAREQLRDVLGAPRTEGKEIATMVEMTVEDVLVQFDEERPGEQRVILLRERKGERVLPIWVGSAEGNALALHLGSELPLRPLTVDLAAKLLEVTGARVERVVISRLHENTFYASIGLVTAGEAAEVDARPSDALNLAVRVGAPIYVEDAVLGEAALAECELPGRLDCEAEKAWGPERQSGEWRPLPPELAKSFYAPPRKRGSSPR